MPVPSIQGMEKRYDVGRLQKENILEKGIILQYERKIAYIEKIYPNSTTLFISLRK